MEKTSYYIINAITFYRVLAAPVLFLFIFTGQTDLFKWLLGLSFFTDAIDGYLARRYKVTSVAGARLDSLGDDLTVLAGIIGLFVLRNDFISRQYLWVAVLLVLLAVQVTAAFWRYGKMTSFHTWLAKSAAVLQGIFLIYARTKPAAFLHGGSRNGPGTAGRDCAGLPAAGMESECKRALLGTEATAGKAIKPECSNHTRVAHHTLLRLLPVPFYGSRFSQFFQRGCCDIIDYIHFVSMFINNEQSSIMNKNDICKSGCIPSCRFKTGIQIMFAF